LDPRVEVLKASFDVAHMVFNGIVGDLAADAVEYSIPGSTVPKLGAIMAHAIYGEDVIVNGVSGKEIALTRLNLQASTGMVQLSNVMTPEWCQLAFDLEGLKAYAAAVFAETDDFLSRATTAELDRLVPTPLGTEMSGAARMGAFGVVHLMEHAGEISALKGAHGLKGLPF